MPTWPYGATMGTSCPVPRWLSCNRDASLPVGSSFEVTTKEWLCCASPRGDFQPSLLSLTQAAGSHGAEVL